jgi:predicted flap endonuclease-1-like 5' DNA nuclease
MASMHASPSTKIRERNPKMRAFKVFIFGLLYGWFFKIAFDRIYRENEIEDVRNENASLKEYIRTLEERLTPMSMETKFVTRTAPQPEPAPLETKRDNLKAIKGIGPAIEKKLNNAGIFTYTALANLSVEELENILGNTRRLVQEGDLISQAKKLAGQKKR